MLTFWSYRKNPLDQKHKVNYKIYDFTTWLANTYTAQKMKFSIKDFFSKNDQIRIFLRIQSHLLKKSLMENFFFCTVITRILPKMSRSQGNLTLKFGQLIEYNERYTLIWNSCRKWGKGTSSRPLFISWKALIWRKSKWSAV